MEAFGLDGDVTAIEITYVEPKTGTVQRKDVFCDPQQWEWRWQARFLISAELINLLSEAFGARHDRFRHYHGILTNCRLGYLCDLWRLRKGIEGIMATLKPEDLESEQLQLQSAQGRGEVGREVGPVHFFIPDHYLDGWTVEHLAMAVKACIEALRAEVERLAAKLQALGGGDWTQMLELILSKGVSLPDMGNLVMNTCTELAQRREVENHVTGGLADKLEALKPVVEEYELVLKDRAARHVEVKASLAEVSEAVQKLEEALHALQQWKAPEVVNKADPFLEKLRKARQDPAAQARRLAAEARRLLALWAQRLADAQQEAERLRMLLAEWIFKQVSCDQMELVRIENRTTSLETRATMLEEKAAAATRRANELQRKIQALAATMADDEQRIVGLRQELAAAPPPDPSAFKFARLRRELKNLQRREAEIEKETASRQIKLRAIRVELREIYKKLSWQCDLSDDDDDYNDKPYWERRKLATNGLTPFDERHFLYSEKNFHRRRLRKHEAKEKSVTQTTLLSQMEAKRYGKATGSSASPEPVERSLDSFLENTDSLGPFRSPGPGLQQGGAGVCVSQTQFDMATWPKSCGCLLLPVLAAAIGVNAGLDERLKTSCTATDSVLLQANAAQWRSRPAAWSAGPYGTCVRRCGVSTRERVVVCRSFLEDKPLPSSACAAFRRPSTIQNCSCNLFPCADMACNWPPPLPEPEPASSVEAAFVPLGCYTPPSGSTAGRLEGGQAAPSTSDIYDMACLSPASFGCTRGLPFFRQDSSSVTPALCHDFCRRRGLDVSGQVAGACRCGASLLNRAVWHGGVPHPDLLFSVDNMVEPDRGSPCESTIYRYSGHYEVGGIPFAFTNTTLEDTAYIDSIVAGHQLWEEVEEDGVPDSAGRRTHSSHGLKLAPVASTEDLSGPSFAQHAARHPPVWARDCWPRRCGPGGGPWMERRAEVPEGEERQWDDHALVRYYFDEDVDPDRREAFRAAAEEWRSVTCVELVEEASQPWGPFLMIVVDDPDSCYAWSIGYPGDNSYTIVNMGWCSNLRYVGNVIHEIGHVLGMNHEQKRPDAIDTAGGHGPHLLMKWENVPEDWVMQYQQDPDSYTGSNYDGPGDPHSGHAAYDFQSIMQYPSHGRFETVPAGAVELTGQRHQLSQLDIEQVLDMYQCRSYRDEVYNPPKGRRLR